MNNNTVIKIENISKLYRLGEVGTGTLAHDLNRWWQTSILKKEDPYTKIGRINDRTQKAEKGEHVWAVKDINLEVDQGEVLGIIGKNGAGKSTLLKLLSRVTSPTTGTIKTKGCLASLLEVGTGFHPEMTGKENIYMNGTIMGMRKWEITEKLDEIVEFAGVAKYLDTPTKRYSSGMTVRLGFAIAAFLEPEILIVDEVLAVGDAEFQKKAIRKMQDVSHGEGRTVLFVSHNMASIKVLCTNAIILENGNLTFQGETEKAVEKYLNLNEDEESFPAIIEQETIRKNQDGIVNKTSSFLSIKRISIMDEQLNPKSTFISDQRINIKFDFDIFHITSDLRIVLSVVNKENQSILNTQLSDSLENTTVYPGSYSAFCTFPANTFGTNLYILTIHFLSPKKEHYILNGIAKFHVKYENKRYMYAPFDQTYLRPNLNWKLENNMTHVK